MILRFDNQTPSLAEECFVAGNATVVGNVALGRQSSIWFGAVLRGDIESIAIGARSNIQDNSVAHTSRGKPVVVGRGTTVGHNVILHGCTVGDHCLIGMGAILLDGCEVGDHCIVAAGALVKQNQIIPSGSMAVGSPARVIRKLSEEEISNVRKYADRYVGYCQKYREGRSRPV